jgi:macrolide-specific efflux system membrane fusion protein
VQPTTAKVARHDITGYLLLPGQLYVPPSEIAMAKAPSDGPVDQVVVSEGKHVDRGDTIVKLSFPEQQRNISSAEASMRAADSAYANARIEFEGGVREAQRALDQARNTERTLRSQAANTGNGVDLESAVADRQAAEEALLQARAEASSNVSPYRQQAEAARIAYNQVIASAKKSRVTAPMTGTVTKLFIQPNQPLTANATVAEVVNLGAIQVKVDLTSAESGVVEEGKEVKIIFNGIPDKSFDGRVRKVDTMPATTTGVKRQATVDFDNDNGMILPRMEVKSVGVKIGEVKDALSVPADSVSVKDGKAFVQVLKDDKWITKEVEVGMTDGFLTEIKSGLNEGETVRVTPS